MAVYLRQQKLAKGRKSYYLDIWHNGQRYTEWLKLYTIKARTPLEKQANEEAKDTALSIRTKREQELSGQDHEYIPKFKKQTDFVAYYKAILDTYQNKDVRIVKYSYTHFVDFLKERGIKQLTAKSLDESICKDFKGYLEQKVNGETISNYYKKFKYVVRQAVKDHLIVTDVTSEITVNRTRGLKKDILGFDDIEKLAKAKCKSEQVKRAFLFCLNTGLRYCDVKEMMWKNIDNGKLRFTQLKVKNTSQAAINNIDLNNSALKCIGEKGKPDDKVFTLPSHSYSLKILKEWKNEAKIEKHITWHCARHSIAVNLLELGTDVKTVAGILGHSNLNHVDIYLRVVDERKKQAVNKLPEISI
jgi:integrase/recombinase XerD